MIDYKEIDPSTIIDNVVPFKSPDGKYGSINNRIAGGNWGISLPFFFDYTPTKFYPLVNIVPFISSQIIHTNKPTYNSGICIGFLSTEIFQKPKASEKKTTVNVDHIQTEIERKEGARIFNTPSYISIGIDRMYQSDSKPSNVNIFLSGTFNF
ncbi:hypothetical protein [Flavobacterium sp. CAU 1735]|uniref:hypothetical protein n=1 Tax=Flavobacterium sp. CAU 1735 TaxID=3140361 RepID=UPI0032612458